MAEIDALTASHVLTALEHDYYGVRIHALRMAEPFLTDNEAIRARVFLMVDTLDPDPSVRLQVALTLGTLQNEASADRLASLLHQHGSDRWMESAILSSANGENGSWLATRKNIPSLGTAMAGKRDSEAVMHQLLRLNHLEPESSIPFLRGLVAGASQSNSPWPEPANGWESTATQIAIMMTDRNAELRKLATEFAAKLPFDSTPFIDKFLNSAKEQALNENSQLVQRVSAIEMLSLAPFEVLAPVVTKLLDPKQSPISPAGRHRRSRKIWKTRALDQS